MKIHIISLGCSKNLVDSEVMKGAIGKTNLLWTDNPYEAEVIIINTCGFIESAREENIDLIVGVTELKKEGVLKKLILTGCLTQIYEKELRESLPEVDAFFGVNKMADVIRYLSGDPTFTYDPVYKRSLMTPRHYAYLKISEGCSNQCSFCAIPRIRGPQKSRTIDNILQESHYLIEQGVKELILIAQDSTMYGTDLSPKVTLTELLREMEQLNIPWIRLHYGHPAHIPDGLFELMAKSSKILPYLDLPVQHINSRILKLMKRGQSTESVKNVLNRARNIIPNVALRTTLITGFPTETDSEFNEMLDFISSFRFDRLGVFKYSEEEFTTAAQLPDNVPAEIKEERFNRIMELQQNISLSKNHTLVGTNIRVLIDKVDEKNSISSGRTYADSPDIDNSVFTDKILTEGHFYDMTIVDATEYDLYAKLS